MKKRIFRETDGIRGKVGEEPLTRGSMQRLGRAIGKYFEGGKVIIGRDTRESGDWISRELGLGIIETSGEVWDVGVTTTPCVGILTKYEEQISGGVMITASHNPASENGIKVFDGNGNKLTDDEELKLEELFFADSGDVLEGGSAVLNKKELLGTYVKLVVQEEKTPGLKVYLDSAAGGTWQLAQDAFGAMGATVEELGPTPDGKNINEECGAAFPEKLAQKVVQGGVDIGIAFDGDGDRLILVDDEGKIWDGDRIVAMLALWLKEKAELTGGSVVMTEYSNLGAVRFLEQNGVKVEKVLNGDRSVAQKCQEIGATLGGEVAGHVIYIDWMSASDALFVAVLVAKIMREKGTKLSALRPDYEVFPHKLWNLDVRERKPLGEIAGWNEALAKEQAELGSSGRVFARYSGTEDKLRILVEAKSEEQMEKTGDALSQLVKAEIGV